MMVDDISLLVVGDNLQVIAQTTGAWKSQDTSPYALMIKEARWLSHALHSVSKVRCWAKQDNLFLYRKREHTMYSDALANLALDDKDVQFHNHVKLIKGDALLATFDGASRGNGGLSSCGASLWLFRQNCAQILLAAVGVRIPSTTNVDAEFQSMIMALHLTIEWLVLYAMAETDDGPVLRVLNRSS